MRHEDAARALVELMQIGKTASGADPGLPHPPAACKRVKVMSAPRRPYRQPQLRVPVGQRRRQRVRPVAAPAVSDPADLCRRFADGRQHLVAIVAPLLGIAMGNDLREDL
jgi:hypothetical protein